MEGFGIKTEKLLTILCILCFNTQVLVLKRRHTHTCFAQGSCYYRCLFVVRELQMLQWKVPGFRKLRNFLYSEIDIADNVSDSSTIIQELQGNLGTA